MEHWKLVVRSQQRAHPAQLNESIVMVGAAKLVNPDEDDWPPHWVPQRPRSPRAQLSRNQSHTFRKISKSNFSSNQVKSQAHTQEHWAPVTPWEVQVSRAHHRFTQATLARAPPEVIQHSSLLIISSCDLKLLPWGQTKITYKGPENFDCRYEVGRVEDQSAWNQPHHIQFQSLVWSWPCALKSSSWTLFSPHALSLCYGQDAGLWGEEGRALHIPSAGHLGMEARLEMEERVSPPPLCLRDVVDIWTIWLWNIFGQTFQPALER